MDKKSITLYGIGGLGADERVFEELKLDVILIPIKWLNLNKDDHIVSYAKRIASQINISERFGIIGVSFGGMLAIELNTIINPEFTILISSASKASELPRIRGLLNLLGIIKILPRYLLKPPVSMLGYLFSAKNKSLLKEIIEDTDPKFIRWALSEILAWKSDINFPNLFSIHGSKDRLIPIKNPSAIVIEEGGHFMIVDHAEEISTHINRIVDTH